MSAKFLRSIGQRGKMVSTDPLDLTLMKPRMNFVSSGAMAFPPIRTKSQILPNVGAVMSLSSRNQVLVVPQDHVPPDLVTRRNRYDTVGPNGA